MGARLFIVGLYGTVNVVLALTSAIVSVFQIWNEKPYSSAYIKVSHCYYGLLHSFAYIKVSDWLVWLSFSFYFDVVSRL